MSGYDRDEVLAHTDLRELADELCGHRERRGAAGARWHCPNPDHPDTHPSMTIFKGSRSERWKCQSCGEGGTAIDLWMTVNGGTVGTAIEALGKRTLLVPSEVPSTRTSQGHPGRRPPHVGRHPKPRPTVGRPPTVGGRVDPSVEAYVATAAEVLWTDDGEPARRWLFARGIREDVLRANRVGFDPGPRGFYRARGLPNWRVTKEAPGGPGVVYPVLSSNGRAVYFQTRYLDPAAVGRDKYDNPWTSLAQNPRIAVVRVPRLDRALAGMIVVTEGLPDGYVAAQTGAQVAAVVGAGNHGHEVARRLHEAFPVGTFAIVWDADGGGRRGGCILGVRLTALGREVVLSAPPAEHNDINQWWTADTSAVPGALASMARPALSSESFPSVGPQGPPFSGLDTGSRLVDIDCP